MQENSSNGYRLEFTFKSILKKETLAE